jgi:hypothetical protein
MTENKATPEQWAQIENWADLVSFSCLLDLRSRVEALESAQRPTVKDSLTVPADSLTAPVTRDRAEDAPAPSDSLVDLVASAISGCGNVGLINWWTPEARAAILTVADWLDQQHLHTTAARLRQDVRR